MYQLIKEAAEAGVLLFVEDGKLGFKLTAAEFPAALKQRIVANKADIVEFLSKHQDAAQNKLPELVAVPRDEPRLKASFAQQRLWFLDEMEGGSGFYNMPFTRFFESDFDIGHAQTALNAILTRHEVLRTYYEGEAGQCMQIIRDAWEFSIREQDFSAIKASELEATLQQAISEESFRPFNLRNDLMLRAAFFKVGEGQGALVITMHHIASDGWSLQVLLQEFDQLYKANRLGIQADLPELPVQYADYAIWQQQWMNDGAIEPQIEFWQKTLDGIPQVHNLPLDNSRPAVQTFNGRLIRQYSKLDYGRISALAKAHNVTPFMLFLAGFSLVLARHSNTDDLVIGTPISGRTDKALQGLIGFFVNMLVLRVNCENNPSFIDYLQQVRAAVLDAQNNQLVPFEYLVERINPVRSVSHSPVFQIVFSVDAEGLAVLENLSSEEKAAIKEISEEQTDLNAEQSTAKYDVTFDVNFDNGHLGFSVEFNTDLFNQESAERFMKHMDVLMQGVIDNPECPVDALPMLTPKEQTYQLSALNQSQQTYDTSDLVHELFEAQALKTPANLAVSFQQDSLTYQALNQRANQLARYLREQGVKPNDIVGICMDRGVELMIAILGVLKAGGGYLPIDSAYPQQRIDYICKNSGLKVLLTTEKTLHTEREQPTLTKEAVAVLSIDSSDIAQQLTAIDSSNLGRSEGQNSQNLIYVIYTSGSTGNPKGVMIEHHNEVNLLHWYRDEYQFSAQDKVLIISAAGFDLTQKNFFAPLLVGGSIHFATQRHYDIKAINHVIKQQQITIINCAPSVFYPLLELSNNIEDFASLRVVLFGGEPIAFNRLQPWLQDASCQALLVNMYGPTECTDIACAHTVTPERYKQDLAAGRTSITLPIGRPNHNVRLYVLNESLQLVPFGSVGELLIGGAGVGRGYIHRSDLNAEKFITNPFSDDDNDLLYHTGDLVRYWPDGNIEFIGRVDHQVKLRGLRIELGEIEAQLTQLDSVEAALLMVREDQPGFQQLVAYVVVSEANQAALKDEQQISELQQAMREAMLNSLPDYMVPSAFILLPEFKLTPNGKIDRKALPVPATIQQQSEYVAPETELQSRLVELWQELLGVKKVGIDDNFFELGGHSLLMTKLIHHVDSELDCLLTLRDVFRHPSIRQLSTFIEQGGSQRVEMQQGEEFAPAPLSYPQYRFWFIEQMSGPTNSHNIPTGYRIEGNIDIAVLQRAFDALVARHRILRTEIQRKEGELIQQVLPPFSVDIEFHDISGAFVMGKDDKVNELAQAHGTRCFDLNKAPYFSVMLVKMKKSLYSLHINLHHLLIDGWSSPVLFNELVEIYACLVEDAPIELPEIPYHYADYARWQHQWLATQEAKEQEKFWIEYLQDSQQYLAVPGQKLPTPESDESKVTFAAAFSLDNKVREKLLAISQAKRGSLFSVLYSGFCVLLSRITGESDFNIGVPVSGRNMPETQSMMGFFLNNLPVRNRIDLSLTFNEFLAQQVGNVETVLSNQELPFERIVELCSEPRSANDAEPPLYQVFFNMSNVPDKFEAITDEAGEQEDEIDLDFDIEDASGAEIDARFKFAMYISQDHANTYINVVYNEAMFDTAFAGAFAEQLENLYAQIADDPNRSLNQYSLVCQSQQKLFDQELPTKAPDNLVQSLANAAKKHKRSIAIQHGNQQWNYHQLWLASQHYAIELLELEQAETIAVIAQRSAALPVALIAVLRAGKTFVVLDAEQPLAYLQQQAQLAGIQAVLWAGEISAELQAAFAPHYPCITVNNSPEVLNLSALEKNKQQHAQLDAIQIRAENIAYIAFTSGTTGEPLAVKGTHAGLSSYLNWMPKHFKLNKKQRFAMLSGLGHDPLQREIFTALTQGATLAIPNLSVATPKLAEWVSEQRINVLHLTPSLAQILLSSNPAANLELENLFITGESLSVSLAQQLIAYAQQANVINSYGTTETQRSVTYQPVQAEQLNSAQFPSVAIASSSPDTKIIILNQQGQRCGISELGEIVIQSAYLSAGYKDNNDINAQKFHQIPDGTLQYHTGDLGRYLPDGRVQLCGRADQQSTIRGFRIDLQQISNTLRELDGIDNAIAHLQPAQNQQPAQLIGYVVSQQTIDSDSIVAALSQRLPSAMLPNQIVQVSQLPTTANNKLNLNQLPKITATETEFVAPVGDIEPRLAKAWCDLLGVSTPSATQTFSELGGNSILITQVIHHIQQTFGVELSVGDCVTHNTIQTQAALIKSRLTSTKQVMESEAKYVE